MGTRFTEPGEVEGHLLPEVPAHVVQKLVRVPLVPVGPGLEPDLPPGEAQGPWALWGCRQGALGVRSGRAGRIQAGLGTLPQPGTV